MGSKNKNSQMGSAGGMAAGAALGTFAMPGVGTLAGAAIGGMAGGAIGGLFGSESQGWYDQGWFDDRRNQIEDFEKNLAGARARYLTSLGNMYNQAYARFTQNAEPGFANRGLSVNGGAFASALARQTADYQAQLEPLAFQAEREDLNAAQGLYQNLFSTRVGAKSGSHNMAFAAEREDTQNMGAFAGKLALLAAARQGTSGGGYNNYGGGSGGWRPGPEGPMRTGTVSNGKALWD